MKIEEHPDIAAIQQLARSLYNKGTAKGAAVLVGAGLSRSARTSENTPPPPLWNDLAISMSKELRGSEYVAAGHINATQLAEEYRSGPGAAALVDFLKRQIDDNSWQPGQIHHQLLELPWSDILTTNYDTLLERTALEAERRYTPILNESDLAHAAGPRIIKLHGTVQNLHEVIISEEDYRQYPTTHAAFLNTARQVLIENELCLIGFSGEDPNFLSWAGWVRDILKSGARRIFLIGILNLTRSKRRFLEKQNIIPIDLSLIFESREEQDHQIAYSQFFSCLKNLEPQPQDNWPLSNSNEYWPSDLDEQSKLHKDGDLAKPYLIRASATWKSEREVYPGWPVPPETERSYLSHYTRQELFLSAGFDKLTKSEKVAFIEEFAWRYHKMLLPLPKKLIDIIKTHCGETKQLSFYSPIIKSDVYEVLLRSILCIEGRTELTKFLSKFSRPMINENFERISNYYQCIAACQALDFEFVAKTLHKFDENGSDPIWFLRKSALLFWLGRTDEAANLIQDAVAQIKKLFRSSPESMWVQSRLAWTLWIKHGLRWEDERFEDEGTNLRRFYSKRGCDPYKLFNYFEDKFSNSISEKLTKTNITPKFDSGSYKDQSNVVTLGGPSWGVAYHSFFSACETIGIPYRTESVTFASSTAQDAYALTEEKDIDWYLALLSTYPSSDGPIINQYFGRISIAQMESDLVSELAKKIRIAISFWRNQINYKGEKFDSFAVDRLRLFIEILARLSIRMPTEQAQFDFKLAHDLITDKKLRHWWLYEHIGNLSKNSYSAVARDDRHKLSPLLLEFPLNAEVGGSMESRWPNIASIGYLNLDYRGKKEILRRRISDFLKLLENGGKDRGDVALRLTYLFESNLLTKSEQEKFGKILWDGLDETPSELPGGTNLYPHVFAYLPSPEEINSYKRVYDSLYSHVDNKMAGVWDIADAISNAARDQRTKVLPTPERAKKMFASICKYQPEKGKDREGFLDFGKATREQSIRTLGDVLSDAVVPVLKPEQITKQSANKLLALVDNVGLTTALPALVRFLNVDAEFQEQVILRIRQAITGQDHRQINDGVRAIIAWVKYSENETISASFSSGLLTGVLKALYRAPELGLGILLHCAQLIVEKGLFSSDQTTELIVLLEDLFDLLDYTKFDSNHPRAVGAPGARIQCMNLANALIQQGNKSEILNTWISQQAIDPLPEVRNAKIRLLDGSL